MTTFALVDQQTRDEIQRALDRSLCVEAGAGTGKTTVLVARIVEILRTGFATVDQLAVITFTEKAAAELAGRVREGLERSLAASADAAERDRLAAAIRGLNQARIETIHAFAGGLLRERPIEAGLDPGFEVLDTLRATLDFDDAFQRWLEQLLQEQTEPLWRALNRGFDVAHLRDAATLLHRHRALLPLVIQPPAAPSAVAVLDGIEPLVAELAELLARCRNEEDLGARQIERAIALVERYRLDRANPDALERSLLRAEKISARGNKKNWEPGAHERQKELCGELNDRLTKARASLRADALLGVLPLVQDFVRGYAEERRAAGRADFDDLLIWTRDLLRGNLEVRAYFQRRFRCLLVDEFQDTDPLQVEIVLYLSADGQEASDWRALRPAPGKLFVVGDPKQSIYRFRRADITIYDWVKRVVLADGQRTIVQNFRSRGAVLDWINDVFARVIVPEPAIQPEYVPLEPVPSEQPPHPPVVVIAGDGAATGVGEIRQQEAAALAVLINAAVRDERWPVRGTDPETTRVRPARWRDVAVLLPRRTGIDRYEEAFQLAGIPYRHEGGRAFFDRQEVRELINCLRAIDDPTDRLSLVAALRSGAFGCSDAEIFQYVDAGGALDLRVAPLDGPPAVAEALGLLASLAALRARLPLPELLGQVITQTHLVEYALTLPQGEQAAANLLKVVDQARAYGAARGGGLRAFMRWLATSSSSRSDEADAAVAEASDDVVRLLTIHSAKGLEFPIVALANLHGNQDAQRGPLAIPDADGRQLHLKIGTNDNAFTTPDFDQALEREQRHEQAEDRRLLYVAATRARDYLIVPALPPVEQSKGMLATLQWLLPAPAGQAALDGRLVHMRVGGDDRDARPLSSVATGDGPRDGAVAAAEIDAAEARRAAWARERADLIARAARERRLTILDGGLEAEDVAGADDGWPGPRQRLDPPAAALDRALHLAWGRIDLCQPAALGKVAHDAAAEVGLPDRAGELEELLRRCLESPVVARARACALGGRFHRGVPFSVGLPDGGLMEGRFDLVFHDDGALVVVDIQGDPAPDSSSEAAARRRAALLAFAAGKATGLPVREVVVILAAESRELRVTADAALSATELIAPLAATQRR